MRRLAMLLGAVLALAACGGGAGGAGSPGPVSGSDSPTGSPGGSVGGSPGGSPAAVAGQPVRGALVVPRPADPQTPGVPEIAVFTDARGRFTWHLRPGSYELVAQAGERRTEPVAVVVKAGPPPRAVELSLPD